MIALLLPKGLVFLLETGNATPDLKSLISAHNFKLRGAVEPCKRKVDSRVWSSVPSRVSGKQFLTTGDDGHGSFAFSYAGAC